MITKNPRTNLIDVLFTTPTFLFYNEFMFKSINKVIMNLILSDVALLTGLGLAAPIFAIFLTDQIHGATIETAGFAAAAYWIVHSLAIIPIGKYLDRNHGEKDDLWAVVLGNIFAAIAVFGYIVSKYPWHIYVLQGIYGLGMAMNMAGYTAIFTRHIDKGGESYEWSVRGAWAGVGTAVSGGLGGWFAYNFGFTALFVVVILFVLFSALLPFFIFKEMSPRNKKEPVFPEAKIMQPPAPKE